SHKPPLPPTTAVFAGRPNLTPRSLMLICSDSRSPNCRPMWLPSASFRAPQCSKLDRLIHPSALGAARTVHIRIIGIDVAAAGATEDVVFRGGRLEAAAPEFRINRQARKRGQQQNHVSQNECG